MIEWSESQRMLRTAVRQFVEKEIAPNLETLEHGDTPPYDVLRKFLRSFGIDAMARQRFEADIAKAKEAGEADESEKDPAMVEMMRGEETAMRLIPAIELCRFCPGMVTAMGVSMGLTAGTIMSRGTIAQKERWAADLLTMDKIGAWAITEPNSGSDAFGSMKATCKRDGKGGYILNGNKTFITNGPYADTLVFICKLDEPGVESPQRKVLSFILDSGMEGLVQSKPFRKMGIHSSPTGELFLQDVKAGPERLLGESEEISYRSGVKDTFSAERSGVAAMALGITERCLELSVRYAKERVQFGKPIGEFQLIQAKLAKMEVARINLENLVFRYIETSAKGRSMTLAEASAMKLYAAQTAVEVAMEAVQIHGGNGYMAEYQVEQLARDAKILQIYGGTDEIQITHIAREMLSRD
ncbi:acyl-CoA dehydrogenase [Ketobacter sp. MCCC 1A13808]|uniref:acyl-CoA dehydrogenase family protein n=1 Tax=Ketobacter sp. MCCC 1A13808 TaxID=2602738 RepID=UPI0012EC9A98|nr:acyl-CoA dehydrogenase family protein [Ketobacter sp. MCCC 1A13808]MVF12916.1 acyl-CoA dehydrogenase [Ketobacter sp. MCCC 1A13808]